MSLLGNILRERRRETALPRMLTYIVTFSCNARCVMCDSWRKPSPNDLTLPEIERVFRQLPRMDAVRLTGGEPFVRKDLPQIARMVQEILRPSLLHITSNGFLTDRIVEFCEQRPKTTPLHLLLSIDGMADKHNRVRGHARAFDSVMRTVATLAPRRGELRFSLAVNQTIVDAAGAADYPRLRDALGAHGVHNHMVMAYDVSATYSLQEDLVAAPESIGGFSTFGDFTQEQLTELLDEAERDIENYPAPERAAKRFYLRGIRNRLLHGVGAPNPLCVALSTHMRMYPNGDVPTCQFNAKRAGNLRTQSFQEVWFSQQANTQRQWVRACKGCWAECEVLPNAIYTGELLRAGL